MSTQVFEVPSAHSEVSASSTDAGPLDIEALLERSLARDRSHRQIATEVSVSFPELRKAVVALCLRKGWDVSTFSLASCDGEQIAIFTITRGMRTFSRKNDFRYKVHVTDADGLTN